MNAALSASLLSPHMTLAAGALLVLAAGALRDVRAAAVRMMAAIALLMALWVLGSVRAGSSGPLVRLDGLSLAWQFLFYAGAIPAILLLDFDSEVPAALLLGSVLGMALLSVSSHLLMLFISFELMSLPAYILVARGAGRSASAREAALKYFFTGGAASALFVMGIAFHYAASGDLNLLPAAGAFGLWAQIFMGTAALFKIGAIPFHFWLPDVYEASDPSLAGFFSTSMKSAGVLLLMRVAALSPESSFAALLPAWGAATMIFASLAALRQQSLARLLGYSSLAHAGFLILGVGAWAARGAGAEEAVPLFFYLSVYLFLSNGAFTFLKISGLKTRSQLAGYAQTRPIAAALAAALLLSLAGIPPTGGFLAKLLIFWEAVKGGIAWPVAGAALATLISLGYYLGLIQAMYFEKPSGDHPQSGSGDILLWVCAVGGVLLGLSPWLFHQLAALLIL